MAVLMSMPQLNITIVISGKQKNAALREQHGSIL